MNRPKILVIEDEPQMLTNLLTVLRAERFTALGAADGFTGLEMARSERPDLILCDIMMPGLDGYGVLERLRHGPEMAVVPFIFLTARDDHSDIRLGMNLGADDYLTKPVRIDDMLAAVNARLARQAQHLAGAGPVVAANELPESAAELLPLGLTTREADVLYWLIRGKANADIGALLAISPATVKKHLEHVFAKLGAENRTAASLIGIERWRKLR